MKRQKEKRQEWIKNGHGEYEEIPEELVTDLNESRAYLTQAKKRRAEAEKARGFYKKGVDPAAREEKIKAKKKRKLELADAQKARNQEAEANEPKSKKARQDMASPRKNNDSSSNKKQQNKRKRKVSENSEQEEEQEEQEDCSAKKCQRPTGKEVRSMQ